MEHTNRFQFKKYFKHFAQNVSWEREQSDPTCINMDPQQRIYAWKPIKILNT